MIWVALAVAVAVPVGLATLSPLIAWRDGIYVASSLAAILALVLLLFQPLLAGGYLPALQARRGRRIHRWLGVASVVLIMAHVAGLWWTSAPDVIDALLFASPTPFSVWGVVAMWAVFATAILAAYRGRFRIAARPWRIAHTLLAIVIVIGSIVHALLIEGIMEPWSKAALCLLVLLATARVVHDLRVWMLVARPRRAAERA